jgi:hypothetical protein
MTVGNSSRPRGGDSEATKPGAAARPEEPEDPSSPRSPLPESWAGGGSRFWALAGESSDEESDGDRSEEPVTVERRSPRSGPSAVNLGDFLSPAWQKVEAYKPGAAGRRRRKFAPGGQGARRLREIRPRRPCGPRSAGGLAPAAAVFPMGEEFPPLVPLRPPVGAVPTAAVAPPPDPVVGSPASVGEDVVGAGQGAQCREPLDADKGAPVIVSLPRVGETVSVADGPVRQAHVETQPTKQSRSRGWASAGPHKGGYLAGSGSRSEP